MASSSGKPHQERHLEFRRTHAHRKVNFGGDRGFRTRLRGHSHHLSPGIIGVHRIHGHDKTRGLQNGPCPVRIQSQDIGDRPLFRAGAEGHVDGVSHQGELPRERALANDPTSENRRMIQRVYRGQAQAQLSEGVGHFRWKPVQ